MEEREGERLKLSYTDITLCEFRNLKVSLFFLSIMGTYQYWKQQYLR